MLLTSVPAPAAASSTESSASSERACAYNQVEGGFVLSSVFVLFHAALQPLKRQNLKTDIEEGKQGEKDLPGWAEGALLAVSGPHWSIQGMAGCEASPTVFTERRPASWQTRARPSGEVPGCSAVGTLHFHCKGGLDSIPG